MGSGEVSKGVVIGAIVAIVAIVVIVGYFILSPSKSQMSAANEKSYRERMKAQQSSPNYPGSPNSGRPGGSGGPSSGGQRTPGSSGYPGSSGG